MPIFVHTVPVNNLLESCRGKTKIRASMASGPQSLTVAKFLSQGEMVGRITRRPREMLTTSFQQTCPAASTSDCCCCAVAIFSVSQAAWQLG